MQRFFQCSILSDAFHTVHNLVPLSSPRYVTFFELMNLSLSEHKLINNCIYFHPLDPFINKTKVCITFRKYLFLAEGE